MRYLVLAGTLVLAAFLGCSETPQLDDEDYISLLLAESDLVEMSPLTSRGEQSGKDVEAPEIWWREVTSTGEFTVLLENDPSMGVCTVAVTHPLQGHLNIDVVHDGQIDPSQKPMSELRSRRVIVQKTGDTSNRYGGWELTHITPAEYALDSGDVQEVFVKSFTVYREGEQIWQTTSSEEFFSVGDGLPDVDESDLVRVEVEVTHTNPVYEPAQFVFVHGPCPVWQRHPLNDDGLYGDVTPGDGVYSYEWYAENTEDLPFVAADVIDTETMNDEEQDDYDAGAWAMPIQPDSQ
ncbi:hypothetical protein GF402_06645 [Candidatus Fermentibacteria bacterium]|nr:hypothetical protein [Candidatus Fermentibacteria bacterium]